jgi:hypothetical protein
LKKKILKKKIVLIIVLIFTLLIGMWIGEKVEKNRKAKERANTSIFSTNYLGKGAYGGFGEVKEVKDFEVKSKIYNVGYIVYSREFAERFGYSASNVVEMPENVAVMEMKIVTESWVNECYLNILVKKDIGLDVPEISYVNTFINMDKFRFPKETKKYSEWEEADRLYRLEMLEKPLGWSWMNYYNQNLSLVLFKGKYDEKYKYNRKDISAATMCHLKEYSKEYYKDYDYLSINIGLDIFTQAVLKDKKGSLWIRKKGFLHVRSLNPKEFMRISIPQELIKKILPIMKFIDKEPSIISKINQYLVQKRYKENILKKKKGGRK